MPAPPVLPMSLGATTRELITQRRCPCGTTGRKDIAQAQALSLRRNGSFTSTPAGRLRARYRTLPADSVTVITAGARGFPSTSHCLARASLRTGPRL